MRNPDKTKKDQLSTIQKANQRNEMQVPLKQQLHAHHPILESEFRACNE